MIKHLLFILLTAHLGSMFSIAFTKDDESDDVWVTVYIHGIMSIKPHLTLGNFYRFMNDKVINTQYAKEVEFIRNDPFFQKAQAMQQLGLHQLSLDYHKTNQAADAIATIFDMVSDTVYPTRKNLYYTFGWSGLLSPTQRYHDAHELFLGLEEIVQTMQQEHGITPKIRLIGYSHGGNISLNLAAIKRDYYPGSTLKITEQVLVGVPLVTETDFLVADGLFEKTYHLYSEYDRIQQIDFFSFNRLFSRKKFKARKDFTLPDTLFQVSIKLRKPVHSTRYKESVRSTLRLNMANPEIVSGNSHLLRNGSPGHIELWFFKWTPQHYRPNFILAPLPVMVFIPYIIHGVQQLEKGIDAQKPIILDMRPHDNLTLVKQYGNKKLCSTMPFYSQDIMESFNRVARDIQPPLYTNDEFNEHIKKACKKADAYYQKNIKPFGTSKIISLQQIRMRKRRLNTIRMSVHH